MNAFKALAFVIVLSCAVFNSNAQSDSAFASQRALLFADSLINSFRYNNLDQYVNISYPGVIKYYGGKNQFREYISRARSTVAGALEEPSEKRELVQLVNDKSEWQCVVKKTRETMVDGKKARIISYLVGQSKDEGNTWRYFDVAYNSVENVIYIMPDIFERLAIPQRQVVYGAFGDTANNHQ
jgi:hypothetical protein